MEISLAQFVLFLLLGSCGFLALASLASFLYRRKSKSQATKGRIICRLCLHVYQDTHDTDLSDCPNCHTRNERAGNS